MKGVLAEMVMATGKNLPFDAGKYAVCKNIEIGTGMQTKFFIMSFQASIVPGEIGVCLPAVCDDESLRDMKTLASLGHGTLAKIAASISIPTTSTGEWPQPKGTVSYPNPFNNKDDRQTWGSGTTVGIVLLLILVAFVAYSTIAIGLPLQRAGEEPEMERGLSNAAGLVQAEAPPSRQTTTQLSRNKVIFEAFSLVGPSGTWKSLWTKGNSRPTDCLDGVKVLSMLTIIMGHGLLEPMNIVGYRNKECIVKTPFCLDAASTQPGSYALVVGQLGVDTFFFIAGFLLSHVGSKRSAPVIKGIILRYMRLLPLFGVVMMFYILISPYLVFGPFSPRMQSEVFTNCQDNTWWSELLFINAFYPWYTANGGCMGWSWYLGVDMVFAALGLALLNIWKRQPYAGWGAATLLAVASIAVSAQQSLYYKLNYNVIDPSFGTYGHYLYSRPYARLPGFLVGLVAPWALDALEKRGIRRDSLPRSFKAHFLVFMVSLIALALALVCVFLPISNTSGPGPDATARKPNQWTPWQSALWIALSRPLWCVSWLVWTIAWYFGYLPVTNAIFSHWVFTPFSALTYGAYLIHPVIIKVIAGNVEDYYTYTPLEAIQRTLFFAVLAYGSSILLWCLVEKPMATLTGKLVPKSRSARDGGANVEKPGAANTARTVPAVSCATTAAATESCTSTGMLAATASERAVGDN